MGYYTTAALEQVSSERVYRGCASREETLTYYLEDLQAMRSPQSDATRYADVEGRYRYYEVSWAAAPGERDICAAIAEVEHLLARERFHAGDTEQTVVGIVPAALCRRRRAAV